MKLAVQQRISEKKSDIKKIRREGNIPAILYSTGHKPEKLVVSGVEFSAILREMKAGRLGTTVFTLVVDGKERRSIIKDIQYQLTSYTVSHIDFEELQDNVPVCVQVPINCIGMAECAGIKLGGFLRQVIRKVKVKCLPKKIPEEFLVDVKDLGIRQAKRLSDLAMPEGVTPVAKMEEVVVVIAKRSA
jgi:large subunit ribosomal protein L25